MRRRCRNLRSGENKKRPTMAGDLRGAAEAIVFLQKRAEPIVGQSGHFMSVATSHVVVIDEGVDDRFFDRLNGRFEERDRAGR